MACRAGKPVAWENEMSFPECKGLSTHILRCNEGEAANTASVIRILSKEVVVGGSYQVHIYLKLTEKGLL